MEPKKFDIKTIAIIILGVVLIISFFFGQKSNTDTHADEIANLHKENAGLLTKNDSLNKSNKQIDAVLVIINKKLDNNEKVLSATQTELQRLKNKQNEIPTYVKYLSANGVANALSDHLTKSSNAR